METEMIKITKSPSEKPEKQAIVYVRIGDFVRPILTDSVNEELAMLGELVPFEVEPLAVVKGDEDDMNAFREQFEAFERGDDWFYMAPGIHKFIRELPDNLVDRLAELVRIDYSKGYVAGNVRFVSRRSAKFIELEPTAEELRKVLAYVEKTEAEIRAA